MILEFSFIVQNELNFLIILKCFVFFFLVWVGLLVFVVLGFFGFLFGRLIDQFGVCVVVICGFFLVVVGFFFIFYVFSVFFMFLMYGGIYGCGLSFVYIVFFEIVFWYFLRYCVMVIGFMVMSFGVGFVIISFICQVFLIVFGWRGVFRGLVFILLIVFLFGWFFDFWVGREEIEDLFGKDEKLWNL